MLCGDTASEADRSAAVSAGPGVPEAGVVRLGFGEAHLVGPQGSDLGRALADVIVLPTADGTDLELSGVTGDDQVPATADRTLDAAPVLGSLAGAVVLARESDRDTLAGEIQSPDEQRSDAT